MRHALLLAFIFLFIVSSLPAQKNIPGACIARIGDLISKKQMDTIRTRGMADNYYLWEPGTAITVKFMPGGSQILRDQVMTSAAEWEKYANIKFKFVPDSTPQTDIRIKLTDSDGAWSMIGLQCHIKKQSEPTMNLDTIGFKQKTTLEYWKGTIMHEFGHSLGLMHEQSYPGGVNWNKPAVYDYYLKNTNWDSAVIESQVFKVSDIFYTNGTSYDSKSIMQYWINKQFTLDSAEIPANTELSAGDKTLIAALYPKKGSRDKEVPIIDISIPTVKVYQSKAQKGIVINPSFSLRSNAKLGTVYFIARLTDENDFYIPTTLKNYNLNGYVASYNRVTVLPNSNITYNKERAKPNLELFIPYEYIPSSIDSKMKVEFFIKLVDKPNNQYKDIGERYLTPLFSITK